MNKTKSTGICSVLLLLAMLVILTLTIVSQVFAESVTVIYFKDDRIIYDSSVSASASINLPRTELSLNVTSNNSKFKVIASSFVPTSQINISSRTVNISNVSYMTSSFNLSNARYSVKGAQAFEIVQNLSNSYTIYYNVSGLSLVHPIIIQTSYDFSTNVSNTSRVVATLTPTSFSNDVIKITGITGFSTFFATEDFCQNGVADSSSGEGGVDCGGNCDDDCAVPPPSGPGGGGGGGGGSSAKQSLSIVPTLEGKSISVRKGDTITVLFNGQTYLFEVSARSNMQVTLKRTGTPYSYTIALGEQKTIGLTSLFSEDIVISVEMSNDVAALHIKLVPPKKEYSLPTILPLAKSTSGSAANQGSRASAPIVTRPSGATPLSGAPVASIPPIEETPSTPPSSPINLWTWIIASLIIILLVGGIAVFRHRITMERPPTATRTGLEYGLSERLPPTTPSEPVRLFSKDVTASSSQKPQTSLTSQAAVSTSKIVISQKKQVQLEKYIYHALAHGFTKEEITNMLVTKGWPNELLGGIFTHIEAVDDHMDDHEMHRSDIKLSEAVEAVRKLKLKGFSKEQIKQGMIRKGWSDDLATQILGKIF